MNESVTLNETTISDLTLRMGLIVYRTLDMAPWIGHKHELDVCRIERSIAFAVEICLDVAKRLVPDFSAYSRDKRRPSFCFAFVS